MTTTTLRLGRTHTFSRRFGWRLPRWAEKRSVRVVLLALLVVMGVAYVTKMSQLSGAGYKVRDIEGRISALRDETQKLEVAVAAGQSMQNISRRLQSLGMVAPATVQYIRSVNGRVAER